MGDANTPQQGQESVSRTFYVLRNPKYKNWFTETFAWGSPSSSPSNTVDTVTQYPTLADAVNAQKAANRAVPECRYEIVMVSRSVTKGVLKSPAKTVRRVIQKGDIIPLSGVKYALANPFSNHRIPRDGSSTSWYTADGVTDINNFSTTPLFSTLELLVRFAALHPGFIASSGAQVVRVVEERVPEVRTEDVVTDILTPLP